MMSPELISPYDNLPESKWISKTNELVEAHPLSKNEIVDVIIQSWMWIFDSNIGPPGFRIGKQIFPRPQILAFFLHELVSLEFERRYPGIWRREIAKEEKDLVHIPDDRFSIEIKASSHANQVFGNRSYAQPMSDQAKRRAGYFITINFEKVDKKTAEPKIKLIRFGWLDHFDWIAQAAATGQQARLRQEAYQHKLLQVYIKE